MTSLSLAFRASSEGGWAESKSGSHKFLSSKDAAIVSQDVVNSFISWAYTGDYGTGATALFKELAVARKKISQSLKFARIKQGTQPTLEGLQSTASQGGSRPLHPLLLNTYIYVFATIYLIDPLRAVSQQKLVDFMREAVIMRGYETALKVPLFEVLEYAIEHLSEGDELLDWLARWVDWNLGNFSQETERWTALIELEEGKLLNLMEKIGSSSSRVNPFTHFYEKRDRA